MNVSIQNASQHERLEQRRRGIPAAFLSITSTSTNIRTKGIPWAIVLLAVVAVLLSGGCVYLDHNLRTVEQGRFYRSGQMPDTKLGETIRRYGIRTVINLRGAYPEEAWYRDEVAVCEALGVAHHDFAWSKDCLPEPESLAGFIELCQEASQPILVHCQGGTHRSGVASAVYRLGRGAETATAREEFHLFFNDAPIGQVLDLYEGSELPFDTWALNCYPALYQESRQNKPQRPKMVSSSKY